MEVLLFKFGIYVAIAAAGPQLVRGVRIEAVGTAVWFALLLGVLNVVIGWFVGVVITVLAIPFVILTFGLFAVLIPLLVNMVLVKFTSELIDDVEIDGWGPAFWFGCLFALGSALSGWVFGR